MKATMEFNWSDPTKNSKINCIMMAKSEASRLQRLNKIKSTLSNSQSKRRKKLKSDGVRPLSRDTNHNNNNDQDMILPPLTFKPSTLDGFDVHAATGGLFHPASTIQAFAELDVKVKTSHGSEDVPERPETSASSTRSRPTTTIRPSHSRDRVLPPLITSTADQPRLTSRSDSRLPTAGIIGNLSSVRSEGEISQSIEPIKKETNVESPSLDLSLTDKFEALKLLIKSNQTKRKDEQQKPKATRPHTLEPMAKEEIKKHKIKLSKTDSNEVHGDKSLSDLKKEHQAALELLQTLDTHNSTLSIAAIEKEILTASTNTRKIIKQVKDHEKKTVDKPQEDYQWEQYRDETDEEEEDVMGKYNEDGFD